MEASSGKKMIGVSLALIVILAIFLLVVWVGGSLLHIQRLQTGENPFLRFVFVVVGLLIALANLDEFIRIIRSSRTREEAKIKLLAFEFSRAQVEAFGLLIRSEARLTNDVDIIVDFTPQGLDRFLESLTERTFGHCEPPLALKPKLYTIPVTVVKYTFTNWATISDRIQRT